MKTRATGCSSVAEIEDHGGSYADDLRREIERREAEIAARNAAPAPTDYGAGVAYAQRAQSDARELDELREELREETA